MAFKPFKWIKKHPLETAAIVALAGTGLGAAGIGPMAGLFAGEGAAGAAGAAGAGAAGAGTAGVAGSALLGLGGLEGMSSALLGPEMAMGMPELLGATPFAAGATTAAPGAAGLFGPGTAAAAKGGLSFQDAMLLGRMAGMGQQQQGATPHLGGPIDMSNPYQRPAMATQDAITKKWLLQNDPATYARLYGQVPQGVV